ncbi:MAG: hypothetical protein KIH10_17555 [Candidatus Freyarchaeota archaeon]|nr:hypothetical protein [Candidatus Jordarchaeia archaeon]
MDVGTWLETVFEDTERTPFSPRKEYPIPRRSRVDSAVEEVPQDILSQIKYLSLTIYQLITSFWKENWKKLHTVKPENCPACKRGKKRRKPHLPVVWNFSAENVFYACITGL